MDANTTQDILKMNSLYAEAWRENGERISWSNIYISTDERLDEETKLHPIPVNSCDDFVALMFDHSLSGDDIFVQYGISSLVLRFKPTDDHTSNITPELIESFAKILTK